MKTRPAVQIATAVAALCLGASAHAGRPLQTEDAGVLAPRACELEMASLQLKVPGDKTRETTAGLGCGVGLNSQLGLGLSTLRAGGERSRGATLGAKTEVWKSSEGDDAIALTLAYGWAAERTDAGWKRTATDVALVATVPVAAGAVHLNVGHSRAAGAGPRSTGWNIAFEHEGFDWGGIKWAPMAELFGDDRDARWWNIAARWTVVADRVYVDLS
jgi:hypothetical protein